jgi:hypothetical protein
MTVSELIEVLRGMDQDKDVSVWNPEWDSTDWVERVEEQDDEVVIF